MPITKEHLDHITALRQQDIPNPEIALRLGIPLRTLCYHIKNLRKAGIIKKAKTGRRRLIPRKKRAARASLPIQGDPIPKVDSFDNTPNPIV